jgi:threonine dehydrogenase-like Zn-dependent dehydrogenase
MKLTKSLIRNMSLLIAGCGVIGLFSGCASVLCGSHQKVALDSKPRGAEVMVYSANGEVVFQGTTPCVAKLKRRGPDTLGGAVYTVLVRKDGFAPVQLPLEGLVNRAYFVNIFNFVGLFIDPVTGAMWTLAPENVSPLLVSENAAFFDRKDGVLICLKDQVPAQLQPYLQPVQAER